MNAIERAISESTGSAFQLHKAASIAGGCINETFCIEGKDGRQFFVKKNQASFLSFFKAEAQALTEIQETQTVHAPEMIAHGVENDKAFLVLEFMKEGTASPTGQAKLGSLLAKMHRVEQAYFGWGMDNCIGATPQPNPKSNNWSEFYRDHRLSHLGKLGVESRDRKKSKPRTRGRHAYARFACSSGISMGHKSSTLFLPWQDSANFI